MKRVMWWLDDSGDDRFVRLLHAVVYVGLIASGVQGSLLQSTPTSVEQSMGGGFNAGWIALLIVAPVAGIAGGRLRDRYKGLILQIAGSVAVCFVFGTYIAAIIQKRSVVGQATFSVWIVASLMVVEFIVIARRCVRLRRVLELAQALKEKNR